MTAYDPPTMLALQTAISRDVHDASNKTFSTAEVNDLINMGIAELNRLQPVEFTEDVTPTDGVYDYALTETRADKVFRVELWRDDAYYQLIPRKNGPSASGWDYFAGTLMLPAVYSFNAGTDIFKVYGYRVRDPLAVDDDVAEINLEGESLIRAYAQFAVFQRLIASRSLFQQWQTGSNNADISATQLAGFANLYASLWREQRMRMKRLRRVD